MAVCYSFQQTVNMLRPVCTNNLLQRDSHGCVVPPIFAGSKFNAVHFPGDLRSDVEDVDVLAAT